MAEPTAPLPDTESRPDDGIVHNEPRQRESWSCWRRTKAKINFAWTYIKPPVAYIWDVIIDINRTVYYFLHRNYVVGAISTGIIIVAILASMKYKWQMNNKEYKRRTSGTTTPSTEAQPLSTSEENTTQPSLQEPTLGEKILNSIVLVWYWRKLREAWTSGTLTSKNTYMIDTSLLGILENFLENGPQLNLTWFYVFWIKEEIAFVPSIVMKSISLLVLTWSIPSYAKAVKRSRGEENLTKCNMLMLFLWNVLQIVPRILIISIFAAEYPIPALVYLACHVTVMTVLLLFVAEENPDLYNTRCLRILHCVLFGFVYIYTYINIADKKHNVKAVIVFYIVALAGTSIIVFYYLFTLASFILIGIYFAGVACMILHFCIGNFCIKP